jgi:UDP-glucose 4-epimerase
VNFQPNELRELRGAYEGRRVLITGGLGFIGSNLAIALVELGAAVSLVDALFPDHGGNWYNVWPVMRKVSVVVADMRDQARMLALVEGQEYIFNLAGQVSHVDSMEEPQTDLEMNCRAQLSLLEACRRRNPLAKIIYASTRQIYGRPRYLPVDEEHPLQPTDVNGIHKMAAEWYHRVYARVYGLATCSLRLTNTYGPRLRIRDARQTFLGWWIRQAVAGEEILVYGDGRQMRDFTYIDDVVRAFLLTGCRALFQGEAYNLGGCEVVALADLAALLVDLAGRGCYRLVPWPEERLAIDIGSYTGNYQRAREVLGWQPVVPLRAGLAQTLDYYRANWEHYA